MAECPLHKVQARNKYQKDVDKGFGALRSYCGGRLVSQDSSSPTSIFGEDLPSTSFLLFLSGGDSYFNIFQLKKDQILSRW